MVAAAGRSASRAAQTVSLPFHPSLLPAVHHVTLLGVVCRFLEVFGAVFQFLREAQVRSLTIFLAP